eukprot:CAMPEP_0113949034 /NCGR_PEP_ID=MMETSP1339-20121228/73443_1 /TAXON_ID=94617 /ORGANISM="Fibrocapsa japonica" /LENGTH=85 /DNA_ID=CAMNT_0000956327 /DNA_START=22 /DNA_END=279 /DNA_ORIENTATION=+ /assembly_acc=CAM_ASM_000762
MEPLVFNLSSDPYETTNIYQTVPDTDLNALWNEMDKYWKSQQNAPHVLYELEGETECLQNLYDSNNGFLKPWIGQCAFTTDDDIH